MYKEVKSSIVQNHILDLDKKCFFYNQIAVTSDDYIFFGDKLT